MSLYASELPVQEDGLSAGVSGFLSLKHSCGFRDTDDVTTLVLCKNQPFVVTTGEYDDYTLSGIYIVCKSMTRGEYIQTIETVLGGVRDPKYNDYTNVSAKEFLQWAISNGYLMGPIAFTEINDDVRLSVTSISVTDETL